MKNDLLNWLMIGMLALAGGATADTIARGANLIQPRGTSLENTLTQTGQKPIQFPKTPKNISNPPHDGGCVEEMQEYDNDGKLTYKISQQGIDMLKQSEGFREHVYLCSAGYPTIGYGHKLREGENIKTITREGAESKLKKDLNWAEDAVSTFVEVPLTDYQYDALVNWVYNIGPDAFRKSTLLKKLNQKDYDGASNEFKRWNKVNGKVVKGLVDRRAREERRYFGEDIVGDK